jgi:hypothetical protein
MTNICCKKLKYYIHKNIVFITDNVEGPEQT